MLLTDAEHFQTGQFSVQLNTVMFVFAISMVWARIAANLIIILVMSWR